MLLYTYHLSKSSFTSVLSMESRWISFCLVLVLLLSSGLCICYLESSGLGQVFQDLNSYMSGDEDALYKDPEITMNAVRHTSCSFMKVLRLNKAHVLLAGLAP